MIQVQLLTGCRPDEVVRLRGVDFTNTSDDVWSVCYGKHKTAHHGIERRLFFGPRSREVISPFLKDRPIPSYLFSPIESEAERREKLHTARETPMCCGNHPGSNRKRNPARQPRNHYDVASYRRAIGRACEEAFPPPEALRRLKTKAKKGDRWESRSEWKNRLGDEKWSELAAWQAAHAWCPNRLRHSAATNLRREFGIEVAQTVLGHRIGSVITEIYAEANLTKAMNAIREVG